MMKKWNAVVLAGDRGSADPVAKIAKVDGKALAKLNDITLIERIINVLNEAECINEIYTLGPRRDCLSKSGQVMSIFKEYGVNYLEPEHGPSASALLGVKTSAHFPTLVVTSDLPLLNADIIEDYCSRMENQKEDFVVTAVNYLDIKNLLPELKKTKYKFAGKEVCFANIFAVLKPPGMKALSYWQDVEQSRKNPLEVIRKIDWWSVLRYKFGCLDIEQASESLSKKLGAKLTIEQSSMPELAIDLDSEHDFILLTEFMKQS